MTGVRWLEGPGLHTGEACATRVVPGPPGSGLAMRRIDGPLGTVPLSPGAVSCTTRRTVIGEGDASVSTVEHLLAAMAGLGIWDAAIEVRGPEIPALDGSALPFVEALCGVSRHEPPPLELRRPVRVEQGDAVAVALPASCFSIEVRIAFDHPAVGEQEARWDGGHESFCRDIAPARTFGFLREVAVLTGSGLALGGNLGNALVYGPAGPMSPERLQAEPARHKLLDAVGDLALLGRPVLAEIHLDRPGHALTVALADAIGRAAGSKGR